MARDKHVGGGRLIMYGTRYDIEPLKVVVA